MRPVSRGDRGKEVVDIQTRLRALDYSLGREGADGHFGPQTERATREFQQGRLILADGVVGENTWAELVEAGYAEGDRLLYLRLPHMRGDDVLSMQRRLSELGFDSGPEDGIFGPLTEAALIDLQRNAGLNVDGIVGEATLAHLRRIRKAEPEGQGRKIPDRMNGYVGTASLEGLRVSLDPAHGGGDPGGRADRGGPRDPGGRARGGVLEKDVNLRVVHALAARFVAEGASVLNVRDDDRDVGLYARAAIANAWAPNLHLCVHHAWHPGRVARGAATYYFANGAFFSESGKRLAGYVVGSLVDRLRVPDLHPHGRNYACLREIDCLALMIEPGHLSHPEEGSFLASSAGAEAAAEAILAGVRAYLERR